MKTILLGISIFLASVNISCGQSKTNKVTQGEKAQKIEELLAAYALNNQFNGSVLVAHKGEVIYKKGVGMANMEWEIPNAPDTKHRIASITKQFTAMLILQLAAEKKLDLNTPISEYLPNFPSDKANKITVHQLLTHSSGLTDYARFDNYRDFERERHNPQKIVELFKDLPLEFRPGQHHDYCNSGYILLGIIIENLTGKPFERALQSKILTPLNMTNTGYDDHRTVVKNRSNGYTHDRGKYNNANFLDMSLVYSAGAMYSTVEDLQRWNEALYTEEILPKEYAELMFKKHVPAGGRNYGYGWFIGDLPKADSDELITTISHGGGMDGVRTEITRIPESESVIILLCNTENSRTRDITFGIGRLLHDQPYDIPEKAIELSTSELIAEKGIEAGMKYYADTKNTTQNCLNEYEMIMIGYDLMWADNAKDAATFFEFVVESFPESYNAYDSYGEALKELGRNEEAISAYKKSVELNPENQNGVRMLRVLGADVSDVTNSLSPELKKLFTGTFSITNPRTKQQERGIEIREINGELFCLDKDLKLELFYVGDNKFINQNSGLTIQFSIDKKENVTLEYTGGQNFKKCI